ncbi:MAG: diguanylate cyclase [Alphaproteobacteria bacterium]|nr:diguanylate cyclase [Alphaproteobacteria bacterium]
MGGIEIFANQYHAFVTLSAVMLLFFSCIYSTSGQDKLFTPIWLFFVGLILDLGANGIAVSASAAYNSGESIYFYVFAELLFSLASMLFMILSVISFALSNSAMLWGSLILGSLGILTVALFVFLVPDGDTINSMRQIFPLAGIISVAVGFWGQCGGRNKSGFIFAALIVTVMFSFILLRFVGVNISSAWYYTALSYVLLSFAFIMMKVDFLYQKTDRYKYEIEQYNQKIEEIIRLSPFPIIISRLGDDKIVLANNNAIKLFGINPQELERYKFKDFFADMDNRHLLNERLETEREVQDFEVLIKTPYSDVPFWLLASANVIDYNYELVLYTAFQDITSRKNRETLLQNQATRDPLTSVYNRRYFEDEVAKRISIAKQQHQPYSVLMLDADHFKNVNDTYGHKIGDKVLIELAAKTERALRDHDIVARYGGEEFVVFLPDIKATQGAIVAERLRQSIERIVVYSDNKQEVRFTVSIGVSSSDISDNVDTLIKTADAALYKAKNNGRNRVEVFTTQDLSGFSEEHNHNVGKNSQHPVFEKENSEEVSLIDDSPLKSENLYPPKGEHDDEMS